MELTLHFEFFCVKIRHYIHGGKRLRHLGKTLESYGDVTRRATGCASHRFHFITIIENINEPGSCFKEAAIYKRGKHHQTTRHPLPIIIGNRSKHLFSPPWMSCSLNSLLYNNLKQNDGVLVWQGISVRLPSYG